VTLSGALTIKRPVSFLIGANLFDGGTMPPNLIFQIQILLLFDQSFRRATPPGFGLSFVSAGGAAGSPIESNAPLSESFLYR